MFSLGDIWRSLGGKQSCETVFVHCQRLAPPHSHEIAAGIVYKDANVTVTAFTTRHAMESYGYRFDTPDRSIVITGDTAPTQATIDACNGCDVLIHEVNTLKFLEIAS
jgi:ribonuclease BN (tRNA processing enzyme)